MTEIPQAKAATLTVKVKPDLTAVKQASADEVADVLKARFVPSALASNIAQVLTDRYVMLPRTDGGDQ